MSADLYVFSAITLNRYFSQTHVFAMGVRVKLLQASVATILLLSGCAAEDFANPLSQYEEVEATTILSAPDSRPGSYAPESRDTVLRGKYLVELLGCGACHSDGALVGDPDPQRQLAGSRIGIAYTNPLGDSRPGIVYPSNITPDDETGIGGWTDVQVAAAIRAGQGRHGSRRIAVMPWQGYAKMSHDDAMAIAAYLLSISAVSHDVPDEVEPGTRAQYPFVYFGVYQSR